MPQPAISTPTYKVLLAWVGIVLMLPVGYLYLASGLVAPQQAVFILWAIWAIEMIMAVRSRTKNPWLALAMPAIALGGWVTFINLGALIFGWTA